MVVNTSSVSTTDGWSKLNFASCVIRQTHSLGLLVLCSVCNIYGVCLNYIYDVVVDTQFHKFHGRPFARVLYVFLLKYIGLVKILLKKCGLTVRNCLNSTVSTTTL